MLASLFAEATVVKQHVVNHESRVVLINEADENAIASIISYLEYFKIEKINIHSYSLDFEDQIKNQIISEQRLDAFYDLLTEDIEDDNNIEMINVNTQKILPKKKCSYTILEFYFLERNNEAEIPGIEKVLFPEEFEKNFKSYIPKQVYTDTKFEIKDIYFHGNSAVYKKNSEKSLNLLLNFMNENPSLKIRLEGHVNGKLSKAYLKEAANSNPEKKEYESSRHLSLERANSVKKFLEERGVSGDRILVEGKGADHMKNKKPRNRKEEEENRRIEVVVL